MDITCIFNGALTLIEAFDFPFFPIYPLSFEQSFLFSEVFLIALINNLLFSLY